MKKQFSPFTGFNWLKWVVIVTIVFIVSITIYATYLYQSIENSKQKGFTDTQERALNETDLVTIEEIERFHGELYYHVVKGETDKGESAIAYIPVDAKDEAIYFFLMEEMISKEQALAKWREKCSSCQLKGIQLAIDKDKPLWEVKYINNKDRFVFEYFSMHDGESYSIIPLKRSIY